MAKFVVKVKRVNSQPRETDNIVRPVLRNMSDQERVRILEKLLKQCEQKIEEIKSRIAEEQEAVNVAAVEYRARGAIFENAMLDDLAAKIANGKAQIETFQDEISNLDSLGLYCQEELRRRYSRN